MERPLHPGPGTGIRIRYTFAVKNGGVEVWLVRHGETPRSRSGRLAGWVDTPLSPHGREQARALRPLLANHVFRSVWSSDLRRAVTTARLAFGDPCRDPRLRELDFGELEGLPWRRLPEPHQSALERFWDLAPPGGETAAQLRRRVADFLDELPSGRHLLFTHGGVIRAVRQMVGDDGFVPTGTLVAVDWSAREPLFTQHPEQ